VERCGNSILVGGVDIEQGLGPVDVAEFVLLGVLFMIISY
jgi:hypothetical protein